MNIKNQTQDRQQILIDLYMQYLLNEITLGQLLTYLRKNILGMSQEQYANLVGVSRRTLTENKLSIQEISNLLGYADISHFSRAFKKWTNMTPSNYRIPK